MTAPTRGSPPSLTAGSGACRNSSPISGPGMVASASSSSTSNAFKERSNASWRTNRNCNPCGLRRVDSVLRAACSQLFYKPQPALTLPSRIEPLVHGTKHQHSLRTSPRACVPRARFFRCRPHCITAMLSEPVNPRTPLMLLLDKLDASADASYVAQAAVLRSLVTGRCKIDDRGGVSTARASRRLARRAGGRLQFKPPPIGVDHAGT